MGNLIPLTTIQTIRLLAPVVFASLAVMCLIFAYGFLLDYLKDNVKYEAQWMNGLLLTAIGVLAFVLGLTISSSL